jgi:hypothetical protein
MELREFVRASLVDIATAIQEAQRPIDKLGGILNPSQQAIPPGSSYVRNSDKHFVTLQQVEFDVAVTASKAEGSEAKGASRWWASRSASA